MSVSVQLWMYGEDERFVYTNLQWHSKFFTNKMFSLIIWQLSFSLVPSLSGHFLNYLFTINPPQNDFFTKSVVQVGLCLSI